LNQLNVIEGVEEEPELQEDLMEGSPEAELESEEATQERGSVDNERPAVTVVSKHRVLRSNARIA
jgi:hypothetical protein